MTEDGSDRQAGEAPLVLVTGASGAVGRALVVHLLEEGWQVRGLARSQVAADRVRSIGARPVYGHLFDPDALRHAADGCRFVFHVAGLNAYCLRDPSPLFRINVRGSLNVLRAAEAAGVERLVHTSSAVTIGEERGSVGREDSPHRGHYLTDYERSKHEAELALLSEHTAVERVVVNPSSVHGPGRREGTGRLLLDLARGRLTWLVEGRLDMIDIEDCARGHRLAAERGRPGRRYLLSGFQLDMRRLVAGLEGALGHPLSVRYLPASVLPAAARLALLGARLTGRDARLCPETARNLRQAAVYDGGRARSELGLDYRGADQCLARLVAWYRRQGWVPPAGSQNCIS